MRHSELSNRATRSPDRKAQDKLTDLAQRIRRLAPDHRDPHRFHEEKSEIAYELTKMARQ